MPSTTTKLIEGGIVLACGVGSIAIGASRVLPVRHATESELFTFILYGWLLWFGAGVIVGFLVAKGITKLRQ